jgi:hypothetical protein
VIGATGMSSRPMAIATATKLNEKETVVAHGSSLKGPLASEWEVSLRSTQSPDRHFTCLTRRSFLWEAT